MSIRRMITPTLLAIALFWSEGIHAQTDSLKNQLNVGLEFEAGNYENYCDKSRLHIVHTPHEHDLMMDDASLDIIVPELFKINGTLI